MRTYRLGFDVPAPMDEPAAAGDTLRVLLVEDDDDQRRLIAWMLRSQGWEVLEAASGVDLLDWIGKVTSTPMRVPFDVIVSDVNMPDLSALEVLSGWRYGRWPTPIVLVTASDEATMRSEARALGASAVLAKPIEWDRLRRAVEQAAAGGRSGNVSRECPT
jgi:CheY-like chemotaxis protein